MKLTLGQAIALAAIRAYKRVISPWLGSACRFTPTCSEYAFQAIECYGLWCGSLRALRRLGSCHPLHRGGFNPIN